MKRLKYVTKLRQRIKNKGKFLDWIIKSEVIRLKQNNKNLFLIITKTQLNT